MKKFKAEDIKVEKIYVNEGRKRARQVVVIRDGLAFYRSFRLPDGKYMKSAFCSVDHLANWAGRHITYDEFCKLDISEAERTEERLAS